MSHPNDTIPTRRGWLNAAYHSARRIVCPVLAGCWMLACVYGSLAASQPAIASIEGPQRLTGHAYEAATGDRLLPRPADADSAPMTLTVVMRMPESAAFRQFEDEFRNPKMPGYQKPIPADEFTARFGPTQEAYDAVRRHFEAQGFTTVHTDATRMTLSVQSTRANVERALSVTIADVQRGDQRIHATLDNPALPGEIAGHIDVIDGLTSWRRAHPATLGTPNPPQPGSIMQAYNNFGFPQLTGQGQTVVLLENSAYTQQDVVDWLNLAGLPQSLLNNVSSVTMTTPGQKISVDTSEAGAAEVLLDVAAVVGAAPGAKVIVLVNGLFYPSSDQDPAYQANETRYYAEAISLAQGTAGFGGIISNSWTSCEGTSSYDVSLQNAVNHLITNAAYSGTTVFVAAGDMGNGGDPYCYPSTSQGGSAHVEYPADLPAVVSVGGTTLNTTGSNNTYLEESWFSSGGLQSVTCNGGFGVSKTQTAPWWQSGLSPSGFRSIPDVSADAAPSSGIALPNLVNFPTGSSSQSSACGGETGGTSLAAPLWAATWAIVSQAAGSHSASLGWLYDFANYFTPAGSTCSYLLHSPGCDTGIGNDFQHLGLGSPNISNLIVAFADVPYIASITPTSGPASGGTSVTVTGFFPLGSATTFWIGANPAMGVSGVEASNISCSSMSTCTFTTPPHAYGSYSVVPHVSEAIGGPVNIWGEVNSNINFVYPIPLPPCKPTPRGCLPW